MIKYLNLLFVVLLLATACKNEKETPSGMKYTVIKPGNGTTAKRDQIIVFDYLLKDAKDSVWANTFEDGVPAASMIGDSTHLKDEDGMTQMFRMLSVGDSVSTSMTIGQFFKQLVRAPIPPKLDSSSNITYTVKVQEITSMEEYYKKREQQVLTRDNNNINKYVIENHLVTQTDTTGLQYILHSNGGGQKPEIEDCVEVKYTGKFLKTGRIFDKSDRIAFPLNGVIAGWKFGIPLLGKGDSATLFIPSRLAYGPQGYPGAIPPDAVLMFNVTLLDVKKNFDPQTRTCK
jgi:FKBP-type peptidyl-prolyl cis-trans isomerase FkpA